MILKIVISLVVFVQFIEITNCECSLEDEIKADRAFSYITVFGWNRTDYPIYALDETNFAKQCRLLDEEYKHLKEYWRKCSSHFRKQILSVMLKDAHRGFGFYCAKTSRHDFLQHNICGQATKQQTRACMDNFVQETNKITLINQNNKIPFICASTANFEQCVSNRLKENKECTSKAITAYTNMVNEYIKSTKALICMSGMTEQEERLKIKHQLAAMPAVSSKFKSILIPFLENVATISEDLP